MNDGLKEFINVMGMLTELWILTHKNFTAQGYSGSDAMMHTREFMTALMSSMMTHGKGGDNTE